LAPWLLCCLCQELAGAQESLGDQEHRNTGTQEYSCTPGLLDSCLLVSWAPELLSWAPELSLPRAGWSPENALRVSQAVTRLTVYCLIEILSRHNFSESYGLFPGLKLYSKLLGNHILHPEFKQNSEQSEVEHPFTENKSRYV